MSKFNHVINFTYHIIKKKNRNEYHYNEVIKYSICTPYYGWKKNIISLFDAHQLQEILNLIKTNSNNFSARPVGTLLLECYDLFQMTDLETLIDKIYNICKVSLDENRDQDVLLNLILDLIQEYKHNFFIQIMVLNMCPINEPTADEIYVSLHSFMDSEFIDFLFSSLFSNNSYVLTPTLIDTYSHLLFNVDFLIGDEGLHESDFINPLTENNYFKNTIPAPKNYYDPLIDSPENYGVYFVSHYFPENLKKIEKSIPLNNKLSIIENEAYSTKEIYSKYDNISELKQNYFSLKLWKEVISALSTPSYPPNDYIQILSLLFLKKNSKGNIIFKIKEEYLNLDLKERINILDELFRKGFNENDIKDIFIYAFSQNPEILYMLYMCSAYIFQIDSKFNSMYEIKNNSFPSDRSIKNFESFRTSIYKALDFLYSKHINKEFMSFQLHKTFNFSFFPQKSIDNLSFFDNLCSFLIENKSNYKNKASLTQSLINNLNKPDTISLNMIDIFENYNGIHEAQPYFLSNLFVIFIRFGKNTQFKKCKNPNCNNYFIASGNNNKYCNNPNKNIFDPELNEYISCKEYLSKHDKTKQYALTNSSFYNYSRHLNKRPTNLFHSFFNYNNGTLTNSNFPSLNLNKINYDNPFARIKNKGDLNKLKKQLNRWLFIIYSSIEKELFKEMMNKMQRNKYEVISVEQYNSLFKTFHIITSIKNNKLDLYESLVKNLEFHDSINILTLDNFHYRNYEVNEVIYLCDSLKQSIYKAYYDIKNFYDYLSLDSENLQHIYQKPQIYYTNRSIYIDSDTFLKQLELDSDNQSNIILIILFKQIDFIEKEYIRLLTNPHTFS